MNFEMTIGVEVEFLPEPYLENLASEFGWDAAILEWGRDLRRSASEVLVDDPDFVGEFGVQVTVQPTARAAQLHAFVLKSPFGKVAAVGDLQEGVAAVNELLLERAPELLLRAAEG